jgi:hypothetical protein
MQGLLDHCPLRQLTNYVGDSLLTAMTIKIMTIHIRKMTVARS